MSSILSQLNRIRSSCTLLVTVFLLLSFVVVILVTNTVTRGLHQVNRKVCDLVSEISATMEEMSAMMEETSASLQQIDESSSEMNHLADSMKMRSDEGSNLASAINNRTSSLLNEAVSSKKTALEMSEAIGKALDEKIERSRAVAEIRSLTDAVTELAGEAQRMLDFLNSDVIEDYDKSRMYLEMLLLLPMRMPMA